MFNNPIPIKLKLHLKADLNDSQIKIIHGGKVTSLTGTERKSLELNINYDGEHDLEICEFQGFGTSPDTSIAIERLEINGYEVNDFYSMLYFGMTNNLFVENKRIRGIDNVCFNGKLGIDSSDKSRDRMVWFPWTYSHNRNDMVWSNETLNCQSHIGCYGSADCLHDPPYKIFDSKKIRGDDYDFVALGCSYTAGTGIDKRLAWPSVLEDRRKIKILNLGVPGGGFDTVLINLKWLVRNKIQFKKVVILLPAPGRRVSIVRRHDLYFHLVTCGTEVSDIGDGKFCIFFQKDELTSLWHRCHRKMVIGSDSSRDEKILRRMARFLESNNLDFKIGSWSTPTDWLLRSHFRSQNVLPMFNPTGIHDKGADGQHPAEHIHQKWVDLIENKI